MAQTSSHSSWTKPQIPLPAGGGDTLTFGFTLDDTVHEGLAALEPEGAALRDCAAAPAAHFARWLRRSVVPAGVDIAFNTAWGLEEDLPGTLLPEESHEAMIDAFIRHIEETGGLD